MFISFHHSLQDSRLDKDYMRKLFLLWTKKQWKKSLQRKTSKVYMSISFFEAKIARNVNFFSK